MGRGRLCPFDLQGRNKSLSLSSPLPGALLLPSASGNQSLPVVHGSQGLVGLPRASALEQAVAVGLPGAPPFNMGILDLKTPCLMGWLQRFGGLRENQRSSGIKPQSQRDFEWQRVAQGTTLPRHRSGEKYDSRAAVQSLASQLLSQNPQPC